MFAAANGHDAIVTLLLAAGADPNLKDMVGIWYRVRARPGMCKLVNRHVVSRTF